MSYTAKTAALSVLLGIWLVDGGSSLGPKGVRLDGNSALNIINVVEFAFWGSLLFLTYVEVGYPLLLWIMSKLHGHELSVGNACPKVTILITAYNEEQVIRAKLENTLNLDYPRDRLQMIVASDGSTDRTGQIVLEFSAEGVQLFQMPQRQGKVATLRAAESLITGDVVLFSDSNSMYEPDALRKLVRHFSDPKTGAVSGHEIRLPSNPKLPREVAWF